MLDLTVVIPTYARNEVLINSIRLLLPQLGDSHEIIVVDQTEQHAPDCERQLRQWADSAVINWIVLSAPSVTSAMNEGLIHARGSIVLFLDDDIEPGPGLLDAHLSCYAKFDCDLVAGRVVQPWDVVNGDGSHGPPSAFNQELPYAGTEFPGGNFSVKRDVALRIRGFDQNFRFAAYRYEREFADRIIAAGCLIRYCPEAKINHLQAVEGGVRSYGSHLTSCRPGHSLGAYYYILGSDRRRIYRMLSRLCRSITTRFHLTHPWFIPVTLVAEFRGLTLALKLWGQGPNLLPPNRK